MQMNTQVQVQGPLACCNPALCHVGLPSLALAVCCARLLRLPLLPPAAVAGTPIASEVPTPHAPAAPPLLACLQAALDSCKSAAASAQAAHRAAECASKIAHGAARKAGELGSRTTALEDCVKVGGVTLRAW